MRQAKVLRLNKAGMPVDWLTRQETATLVVKGQVIWSLGDVFLEIKGGINRAGQRSALSLPSIVACTGRIKADSFTPTLTNRLLFRRDQHTCLYCGQQFPEDCLSRDHVTPVSRNGKDCWSNVVTACKRCNHRKADRTPEEAGMPLLAVPFKPNRYEFFYFANKNILADQMEFLRVQFSSNGCRSLQ